MIEYSAGHYAVHGVHSTLLDRTFDKICSKEIVPERTNMVCAHVIAYACAELARAVRTGELLYPGRAPTRDHIGVSKVTVGRETSAQQALVNGQRLQEEIVFRELGNRGKLILPQPVTDVFMFGQASQSYGQSGYISRRNQGLG